MCVYLHSLIYTMCFHKEWKQYEAEEKDGDVFQIHNYCFLSAVSNTITVFPLKTNYNHIWPKDLYKACKLTDAARNMP